MKKKWKRFVSGMLTAVTLVSTAVQPMLTYAAEPETPKQNYSQLEEVREYLAEDEIVTANDYEIEVGQDFDVECDYSGLEFDDTKVKIIFHEAKNEQGADFNSDHVDSYQAVYYVEPVSGNHNYQISRKLIVKEPVAVENTENASEGAGSEGTVKDESTAEDDESDSPQSGKLNLDDMENSSAETEEQVAEIENPVETESETEQLETEITVQEDIVAAPVNEEENPSVAEGKYDFAHMTDEEISQKAEVMILERIAAGDYELEFTGDDLTLFMLYQRILNGESQNGIMTMEAVSSLVVKNANGESGMWAIPLLDYVYSSETGDRVHNYVKYIADDAANDWRLAYCTQISNHFIDSTSYINKTWEKNGMYSEISYAIAHGSSVYGDKNDSAYTTGSWIKDYYVTQTVIYCILQDYGHDGHSIGSLSAVDGYQDVFDCTKAMYQDVKNNAADDGYGDKPTFKIVPPASTKMSFSDDKTCYESGWYKISATGEIALRNISLSGAPSGTKIIYEDTSNTSNRFYIKMSVADAYKMASDTVNIKINASAKFKRPFTYIYKSMVADAQNITFQEEKTEPETLDSEANVSISLDKCKVAVVKIDKETGNGVAGAVYGVYEDEACKKLIETMPATDASGKSSVEFIKRQNTVYVKEITASVNYLISTEVSNVNVVAKQTSTVNVKETEVKGQIDVNKIDIEMNDFIPQGDAKLEGAIYGLYAKEDIVHPDGHTGVVYKKGTLVEQKKIGSSGKISFGNLYLGSYYVKEIEAPEGYLLDEKEYPVTLSYVNQTQGLVQKPVTVKETVKKQAFELIKISTDGSSTESNLVKDAEFTVKLVSEVNAKGWDAAVAYDVLVTDKNGYALSQELPYGEYLVKETKTPANMTTTKDFDVTISEDSRKQQTWRVFNDAPFKAYIRLIKKDVDTGEVVLIGGTTFKIKDVATGQDISMKVGSEHYSTFVTDETGMVTTPLQMLPGEYEVYEITAPKGYVVKTESIPFTVSGTGEFHTDDDGDFVVDVEIENAQQYGDVSIYKHGEVLSNVEKRSGLLELVMSLFTGDDKDYEFIYEDKPIEGAKFRIVCDEDIFTADHQMNEDGTRKLAVYDGVTLCKDAVVAVLTTDAEGRASVKRLPLGSYHVEEFVAGEGYVLNKENDSFVLEYEGQEVDTVSYESDFENLRQKVELSVIKEDSETQKVLEGAEFGLYNKEDICNKAGDILVEADTLLERAVSDKNGVASFKKDYPLGNYYAKELRAPAGYLLNDAVMELEASYAGQEIAMQTVKATNINIPTTVEITKVALTDEKELPGATLTLYDEEGKEVESWVSTEESHVIKALEIGKKYTLKETKPADGYVTAEEISFVIKDTADVQKVVMKDDVTKVEISKTDIGGKELPGAKLSILDKDGKVVESWTSEEKAHYIEMLPVGKYILHEEAAPDGYLLASDVEFEVKDTAEIQKVKMVDEVKPEEPTPEKDTPKANTPGTSTTVSNAPKTGDTTPIVLWIVLFAFGIAGIGASVVYLRKKK